MLSEALNYKDELCRLFANTMHDTKYMYYHGPYATLPEIHTDDWQKHQFVSLNSKGEVIGFIQYGIIRGPAYYAQQFGCLNFTDDKATFGRDLAQVIDDIFTKYGFNKLTFSVSVGNPIEPSYDRMVKKLGGRIVGTFHKDTAIMNGQVVDQKYYEITKGQYLSFKEKKSADLKYSKWKNEVKQFTLKLVEDCEQQLRERYDKLNAKHNIEKSVADAVLNPYFNLDNYMLATKSMVDYLVDSYFVIIHSKQKTWEQLILWLLDVNVRSSYQTMEDWCEAKKQHFIELFGDEIYDEVREIYQYFD